MSFLIMADRLGLEFAPLHSVVMIRQEFEGRLEVLTSDGRLAHRPGPLRSMPPLVRVGDVLVNPHAVPPPGWEVPPATGPPLVVEDPWLEKLGVRASEVLYLRARRAPRSTWHTDRGELPAGAHENGAVLARWHPDLRSAGRNYYLNPMRMRSLRRVAGRRFFVVIFDDGSELELTEPAGAALARSLGLEDPDELPGETEKQRALRRLGIRRWPVRLSEASGAFLVSEFGLDPERLVANLLAQTVESRRRGEAISDGRTHRGYYYTPVRPALQRSGCMLLELYPKKPRVPLEAQAAYSLMCTVCTHVVGEARLFTYRDLGFRALHPEYRLVGARHPEVLLFVEKETLLDRARTVCRERGVSGFISGGLPPLIGAEDLAGRLLAGGIDEVLIASLCDFDPVGYDLPQIHADHLARYGVGCRDILRLVTPDRFSAEERRRLAVPIRTGGPPNWRARVRGWLERTGGVEGRALALHADHLSADRVLAAFDELVKLP